jgi:hypothetical protein
MIPADQSLNAHHASVAGVYFRLNREETPVMESPQSRHPPSMLRGSIK